MEYGEYCWYSSWTRSTPNLKINNPSKIWRGLVPIHKFFLTNQILNSYRWIYMEGKIQKFPISCYGGKKVVWSRKLNIFFRHRYILNETLKEKIVSMYQLFLIPEPKNLTSNSWCDVCCPGRKKVTVKTNFLTLFTLNTYCVVEKKWANLKCRYFCQFLLKFKNISGEDPEGS